jgi:two-component system sensor histidine kinase KdpD
MADGLLKDLVLNLLDNAVKYCDREGTEVDVEVRHSVRGRVREVTLTVADRGPGIPDADKDSVFYRFVRMIEDAEGSGLGLSLVMALCDRYGGTVWVEDRVPGTPEEGARFVVELPSA